MKRNRKTVRLGFGAAVLALAGTGLFWLPANAQPGAQQTAQPEQAPQLNVAVNLNITPKRLVLERGNRSGTVYIFNQGSVPATFDISLVERVMLPSGEIKPLAEARTEPQSQAIASKLASAQRLLVAAPRRVSLAPGKGQTIRIRATAPADAVGEYRTHLTVTTVPPRDTGVTAEQAREGGAGQLSFQITSVFGLSIPVIVRPGPVDARGAIENMRLSHADISPDGVAKPVRTPVVRFELRRVGANSLFGNVEVRSARGKDRPLGMARGIGVYPEIDSRMIQIPLRRAPLAGEQLEIIFTDDDSSPGRITARSTLKTS
jgi:P pilus assembly chaperone PapD